jgi:hypothetical protein
MKKFILAIIALLFLFTGCESWKRMMKDVKSDYGGGLHRTVTLLDYQGDTVKQWTGKFDVQFDTSGAGQVLFDYINENSERKRVVIQGGIVINEEL